jgi:hypothetical protein
VIGQILDVSQSNTGNVVTMHDWQSTRAADIEPRHPETLRLLDLIWELAQPYWTPHNRANAHRIQNNMGWHAEDGETSITEIHNNLHVRMTEDLLYVAAPAQKIMQQESCNFDHVSIGEFACVKIGKDIHNSDLWWRRFIRSVLEQSLAILRSSQGLIF